MAWYQLAGVDPRGHQLSGPTREAISFQAPLTLQVERRRAERKRAAALNMLSPAQRKAQLAEELATALEQAKQAKASGNKEHKRVAGDAVRQIKQELAASGFKEAEIHALIAEQQQRKAGLVATGMFRLSAGHALQHRRVLLTVAQKSAAHTSTEGCCSQ